MLIQLQAINKILVAGDLHLIEDYNLTEDYFDSHKDLYNFIVNHYRTYGQMPDDDTLYDNFEDEYEVMDVSESDEYLVAELSNVYMYNQMSDLLNGAGQEMDKDCVKVAEKLKSKLEKLLEERANGLIDYVDITQTAEEDLQRYEETKNKGGIQGISTGMTELDDILGGWMPGEDVIVVAGRPNMGKSWIVEYFGVLAWMQGRSVLMYSGEMSSTIVKNRMMTWAEHISNTGISRARLTEEEYNMYKAALKRVKDMNIPFNVVTPEDLNGKKLDIPSLERLIKQLDPDIILVDQLSLMRDYRFARGDHLRIQYGHICEDLLLLSKKYGKPVITACQGARVGESEKENVPNLSNLAESDLIGQWITRLIGIVQTPNKEFKIGIRKNRYGANMLDLLYKWDIDKGILQYNGLQEDEENQAQEEGTPEQARGANNARRRSRQRATNNRNNYGGEDVDL